MCVCVCLCMSVFVCMCVTPKHKKLRVALSVKCPYVQLRCLSHTELDSTQWSRIEVFFCDLVM